MNFRAPQKDSPDVNLTPLIDVVFLLLIFFMVSTTFNKESEIQIDLPEATGEKQTKEVFVVEITIDNQGRYFVNERRVRDNKLDTLKRAVAQTVGGQSDPHIIINSDKDATYQSVMTAMDAVRQLGLSKFSLSVKESQPER